MNSEETYSHQAEVTVKPLTGWLNLRLQEVWEFRELMFFLIWRDIAVKYKQTVIGIVWAVVQPLMAMVVFSVIFGRLAKLDSQGFPYEIFSYVGILPWQFFSNGVGNSAGSIVSANSTITKTYFPRLILPIAEIASGLVDFGIAFVILLGMMMWYQIPFTWRMLTIPLLLGVSFMIALAIGLWLAAWNVKYRDVKILTGFIAILAICHACGVLQQVDPPKMAVVVSSQSNGNDHRWLPLGGFRNGDQTRSDRDDFFCGCDHPFYWRRDPVPKHGTEFRGCGVNRWIKI